jgi:hypothetical protein
MTFMTGKGGYLVKGNTGAETYEENMLFKKKILCLMCECLAFFRIWIYMGAPEGTSYQNI